MDDSPPPSFWGLLSVAAPFLGFLAGLAVGALGGGILWQGHPMDGLFYGVALWTVFCLMGLVAAGIAAARNERLGLVIGLGFFLNAILPTVLLGSTIWHLIQWMRYG